MPFQRRVDRLSTKILESSIVQPESLDGLPGRVVIFCHRDLAPNTKYKASLTTGMCGRNEKV